MFWGLILKANKKYTQVLEKPFHLTKASLDHSTADNEPIQVMYSDGESTFLICTLQKGKELQCSLDLNFAEGDTVCFSTKGIGIVHLSGYMIPDDDFGDEMDLDDEDESVDESEPEEAQLDLRELLQKKKKEKEKAGKKDKKKSPVVEESSDENADESDEDILNGDSTLDSSAVLPESDDDEDDDDEDASDEEDDSDDEEEEVVPPKAKQAKLDPQQKKQQQNGAEKNGQQEKNKKKKDKKEKPAQPEKKEQPKKENKPQADNKVQKLQGGLTYQDLKAGNGAEAKSGKKVQVYYEGRLKSNNKMFDSTKSGAGFKFTLGRGEVIKAWDLGIVGMKVGGKRRVTCPPGLAYGAKGNPPVIPGNSTLVFDVELKNVL